MPNQFEVGSTLGGTYRIVKKLGDTGEYAVFAVEHERLQDRALTLIAPRTPAASRPLHDAATREKGLTIVDVKRTPDERVYVIAELSDAQQRDVLSGAKRLGD